MKIGEGEDSPQTIQKFVVYLMRELGLEHKTRAMQLDFLARPEARRC